MKPKCGIKLDKGFVQMFIVRVIHWLRGRPHCHIRADKSELRDGTMQFGYHRVGVDDR